MNNMAKISSNTVRPQIWVEAYHEILFKYALPGCGMLIWQKSASRRLTWLPFNHGKDSAVWHLKKHG